MVDRYIILSSVYQICTFEEVVAFDISFYIYITYKTLDFSIF